MTMLFGSAMPCNRAARYGGLANDGLLLGSAGDDQIRSSSPRFSTPAALQSHLNQRTECDPFLPDALQQLFEVHILWPRIGIAGEPHRAQRCRSTPPHHRSAAVRRRLPALKRQQPAPSIATWMMVSALVRLCQRAKRRMASSSLRRYPTMPMPVSFRSSAVRFGRTFSLIAF